MDLAIFFKALSDESRLRIVSILFKGDMCACQIVKYLPVTQSTASRHLSALQHAGIIKYKKESRKHIYSLNKNLPLPVKEILRLIHENKRIRAAAEDFENAESVAHES